MIPGAEIRSGVRGCISVGVLCYSNKSYNSAPYLAYYNASVRNASIIASVFIIFYFCSSTYYITSIILTYSYFNNP